MLIRSGTLCRHDILFLTSKSVKILGGEIEALCKQNACALALAKRLNINEANLRILGRYLFKLKNPMKIKLGQK